MTRTEIAADLRSFVGGGMITASELAAYMGLKKTQRVAEKYLRGLERVGNRYWIPDVARRLKEESEV